MICSLVSFVPFVVPFALCIRHWGATTAHSDVQPYRRKEIRMRRFHSPAYFRESRKFLARRC